jgi:hypothetical protein
MTLMIEERWRRCSMARPTERLVRVKVCPAPRGVLWGEDFLCRARLTPLFAATYS